MCVNSCWDFRSWQKQYKHKVNSTNNRFKCIVTVQPFSKFPVTFLHQFYIIVVDLGKRKSVFLQYGESQNKLILFCK